MSTSVSGITRTDAASQPGWRLDQVASAGRENLDAQHVARYDAIEDASADREVALLQQWGLRRESVVVELGTGTGQFAVAAARVCDRVVAADVSPVMMAELRVKLAREQVDNVNVVQAGFLDYEHRGAAADVVYSRYAMHHLPDFWKGVALARIHRALRPGGLLRVWDVVYSFGPHEAEDRLEAWCATGGPDGGDGWSRADYEEHVRDEHSTYTWVFEALAQRAGFYVEVAEYSTDGIFAEYLFRRKYVHPGYRSSTGARQPSRPLPRPGCRLLGAGLANLLSRPDLDRLRRCDGPGCGWLFLDQTRNRSRRWCDPADCGNRARVRAHTERQRTGTTARG